MRALRLVDWKHGPELVDVDDPEPGPGEVRIRVGGAGACHSDLHLMYDFEGGLLPWGPPFTLGHENAGWVDALGPGASGVEVGEAVAVYGPWGCRSCHRCVQGIENYCVHQATLPAAGGGLGTDGGMAAYWGSIPELIALPRAGKIRAHVQRFSLDDAPQAYEQMRAGNLHGRAVVVPS